MTARPLGCHTLSPLTRKRVKHVCGAGLQSSGWAHTAAARTWARSSTTHPCPPSGTAAPPPLLRLRARPCYESATPPNSPPSSARSGTCCSTPPHAPLPQNLSPPLLTSPSPTSHARSRTQSAWHGAWATRPHRHEQLMAPAPADSPSVMARVQPLLMKLPTEATAMEAEGMQAKVVRESPGGCTSSARPESSMVCLNGSSGPCRRASGRLVRGLRPSASESHHPKEAHQKSRG